MEQSTYARREAVLKYADGEFHVITPGSFVRCAVTGQPVPLTDLRYWSVSRQEPYASPDAALKRHRDSAS